MTAMRVALCITELEVGGAERSLVELAVRLDRRRFEPVVYALGSPPSGDSACVDALGAAGIEVHFLHARAVTHFPATVRRLAALWDRQRPDVVQSFLFHANLVSRLAARRAGVRPVFSGIRVAQRGQRWRLWADRWTEGLVDRHVCVSQAVADFSRREGRLSPDKLVVIPNGIDLKAYPLVEETGEPPRATERAGSQPGPRDRADLTSDGIGPDRRLATFVGRLDRQKGVDWLLRSADAWLGQQPDWDLALIGAGPEESRLRRIQHGLACGDRVHFLGWRADVPEILARSDLFVLPSAWEGMPNALLQAMAARLPVVATDVEGVAELLGPGREEQTVGYGDAGALTARLLRLMADRSAADRLAHQNRLRVEEHFSIHRTVAAYQDLWESSAK